MIKAKTNLLLSELTFVGGLRLPNVGPVETDDVGKKLRSAALIEVSNNVAQLLSTDGSAVAQSRVPVSSDSAQPMTFALPFDRTFINTDRLGGDLTIEVAEENVAISHSMGQVVLTSWADIAKYVMLPHLSDPHGGGFWEIPASTLSRLLLTAARFAAADSTQSKFHIDGVNIEFTPNAVRAYAGNGHRLFEHKTWHQGSNSHGTVFVPKQYTRLIGNITPDPSNSVSIFHGDGYISFECPPRSVTFPEPVGRLHPPIESGKRKHDYVHVLTVDSSTLKSAVQGARNTVRDWSPKITFCAVAPDVITVQATHCDLTMETREQVPATVLSDASFSLHADYVLDFLKLVNGAVTISTVAGGKGAVFFDADPGYQYMLLHMI